LEGELDAAAFLERWGVGAGGGRLSAGAGVRGLRKGTGLPGRNPSGGARPLRSLLAAALYRLGRHDEIGALYGEPGAGTPPEGSGFLGESWDSWDRVLPLLARLRDAGEAAGTAAAEAGAEPAAEGLRDFLFGTVPAQTLGGTASGGKGAARQWAAQSGAALGWAAEEVLQNIPDLLSPAERAVLEGRLAVTRSSFSTALALFRPALDEAPDLFQRYPALISDLGRSFQFTASEDEGIDLFLAWERQAPSAFPRYQLLYFAGRIARARGDYDRGRELFTQALVFAPDARQADACVWYIMDTALQGTAVDPAGLIATWMPRWGEPAYFNDILDRIASGLALSGQWGRFPEILALLEGGADPSARAKYAYISGRAVLAGLIPAEDKAVSGGDRPRDGAARQEGAALREAAARPYFRAAYEEGKGAPYYRILSAYFRGEPPFTWPEDGTAPDNGRTVPGSGRTVPGGGRPTPGGGRTAPEPGAGLPPGLSPELPHPREMDFLLGFFTAGFPGLAYPWIEALAGELSTGELRILAEALEAAGAHTEQARLVTAYMGRSGHEPVRRDLELLSPRPFRDLVEGEARRAGFPPELLYALVRTESAFQADVVSWAGAVGLTQLMPATAADMAARMRRQGEADYTGDLAAGLRDPAVNLHIGSFYLAYLRNLLDHPLLSILAYNGGMNRIRRWYGAQGNLPGDLFLETVALSETRDYGRKVISAAVIYGYLYYDMKTDSFLADMCR
jgi:soluble lytic murein transglycosylase